MSSQLCGMPARLPRMHSGHRFMRNIKLMIPTRTDRSPSVSFFISGGVCADFCLHTAMVKRVQTHICYRGFDTSEHFLFYLGWRFCGFLSSHPDGEASTGSYLLRRCWYIGTFSFLSRVTFVRIFAFTPRWWNKCGAPKTGLDKVGEGLCSSRQWSSGRLQRREWEKPPLWLWSCSAIWVFRVYPRREWINAAERLDVKCLFEFITRLSVMIRKNITRV